MTQNAFSGDDYAFLITKPSFIPDKFTLLLQFPNAHPACWTPPKLPNLQQRSLSKAYPNITSKFVFNWCFHRKVAFQSRCQYFITESPFQWLISIKSPYMFWIQNTRAFPDCIWLLSPGAISSDVHLLHADVPVHCVYKAGLFSLFDAGYHGETHHQPEVLPFFRDLTTVPAFQLKNNINQRIQVHWAAHVLRDAATKQKMWRTQLVTYCSRVLGMSAQHLPQQCRLYPSHRPPR